MSLKQETTLRVVLYEGDGSQPLGAADRFTALSTLLEKGFAVTCANGTGQGAEADRSALLVLGRFNNGRAPAAEDAAGRVNVRFQNIDGFDMNRVMETVETVRTETNAARHGDWKPWFPVIDYDRCTNCMQCLSFCLFGVYGVDEQQRITVQTNANCKTNCPDCSRGCAA